MSNKVLSLCVLTLSLMGFCATPALAQRRGARKIELSPAGQELAAEYERRLVALRTSLAERVRSPLKSREEAWRSSQAAEREAEAALAAARKALGEVATAKALVNHAKGKWIGGADRGIAKAKASLKKAKTAPQREAARKELAKWEDNRRQGVEALNERQGRLDAALREQPRWQRKVKDAEKTLARSKKRVKAAVAALGLDAFLSSAELDTELARYVLLLEATPRGLAAFAQQGEPHRAHVESLLADDDLVVQMVVADGARDGKYGDAMAIYSRIRASNPKSAKGALQRLAVAIALEHAVPVSQRNPVALTDAAETIDPVARYKHYERAFLAGELDPVFGSLSVWDYRMVVDGNEPDDVLAWGREMLRSYRPDHVHMSDYRWRYVAAVRTDIRYGSQDNKYDKPELQFFQNILMNGGVCGRRAFFGRFILRAFGIPTTARPSRGHAALAHWTPKGWVVCLGGGWGAGWTKTRYRSDLDFLATTQARVDRARYMEVKRAQWVGDVLGEKRVFGLAAGKPGFWYGVSLYRQRALIESTKAVALAAVGEELGEANESRVKYAVEAAKVTDEDRRIAVDDEGVITIPAVACSKPRKSGGKVIFLPSNLGGKQLHYSRNGRAQSFEYVVDAPSGGTYALTARVVTPSWQQRLVVSVNGEAGVAMPLPHTVGLWGKTEPVTLELAAGRNTIRFSHQSDGQAKGFSIRDFTLSPSATGTGERQGR